MSSTLIISNIVLLFQEYETSIQKPTEEGFINWMLQRNNNINMQQNMNMGDKNKFANEGVNETNNAIGILLSIMNKYAKHYSKIVLEPLPLNTIDEFGYLAHLSTHEKITKTNLITQNLDGKTTGTDIIRRLVLNGLAKEVINPTDKRSKLLKITDKGKKTILNAYLKMGAVSKKVTGNLTNKEKAKLLLLLNKLANYHRQNAKTISIDLTALNQDNI
ncbi:MAG: winged helix-turn-helix transcriptional regulator [Bacteroidia bacterium]|nr:winged helix-turn-helix transcriptional regulator [Bacteroidia bacterium]MBP9690003.1 winged helix-turn-helix transcriptional regulator [Bacteroidia bacterium]